LNFYDNYPGTVHYDSAGNILGEIGLNTRVTKAFNIFGRNERVVEQFPMELFREEIYEIVHYLNQALPYATDNQKNYINTLKTYLLNGDVYDWHLFNREWLQDNPNVDFMLGFVEVYHDPLNMKGSYEGIVNYIDVEETKNKLLLQRMHSIMKIMPHGMKNTKRFGRIYPLQNLLILLQKSAMPKRAVSQV